MKLLIKCIGFLGDNILVGSLAENCKKNGFERVDLLIRFPHTLQLLKNNSYIDNVYLSSDKQTLVSNEIDYSIYDDIYTPTQIFFNEKPLDTFNKHFNLKKLEYDFNLYVPDVFIERNSKPLLAFHHDWYRRSFSTNKTPRDPQHIIDLISDKYDIYLVGSDNNYPYTHYDVNENTHIDFLKHCAIIKECDLYFGYPGGMHWVAGGVRTPSITTSEWMVHYHINNGDFKGSSFKEFNNQYMLHNNKHFSEPHILLEPEIPDEDIIKYLLNFNI